MRHTLSISTRIYLASALLLLSLGCGLITPAARNTPLPLPPAALAATATPVSPPAPTKVSGEIGIDYVYTTNYITLIYQLYGNRLKDFVTVTLTNPRTEAVKILVESEITGYTTRSADTVTLAAGETREIGQNPRIIPSALEQLNASQLAQFHIRVEELGASGEKLLLDDTGETTVYARRDFPFSIEGFTDEEIWELVAALVTPNDPAVEELVRKAADYTESGIIWSGYGDHENDDDGGVWDRLQAIWRAEEDYNLTYVSTSVSFAPGSVQRMRLPFEVLDQRSGNCIELALLYASAAEALKLEAAVIGVPGHAYVAIRTDQKNARYYTIETTLIGRSNFSEAVEKGAEEFDEMMPHLQAGESGYGWTKVWEARDHGIMPLQWH